MSQSPLDFPAEAVWIGSDHAFDLNEVYLRFRSPQTWQLRQQPRQADLFITADSRYKLWVNDRFVARGPARCYPHAQSVDRLELAPYLQAGPNCLAVQVYQPGYSHFAYVHRAQAGLLAHLVCDGQTALFTDARWRTRRDPSFAAVVPRVSIYGSGVEERDLRLADRWTEQDYDASGWNPARVVAPVGGYPWTGLQLRSIPLLEEREASPRLVVMTPTWPCRPAGAPPRRSRWTVKKAGLHPLWAKVKRLTGCLTWIEATAARAGSRSARLVVRSRSPLAIPKKCRVAMFTYPIRRPTAVCA